MGIILNIETSTAVCSVAISDGGVVVAMKEVNEGFSHAEKLTLFIESVLEASHFSFSQLDAIAVSSGPGSYTGLRIGVSTAKGLCYALDKPLISIPTLFGIANAIRHKILEVNKMLPSSLDASLIVPMIDARRMEVYRSLYTFGLEELEATKAEVISEDSFSEQLNGHHLILGGDGAGKFSELFQNNKEITILNDVLPSARFLAEESEIKYRLKDFEDTSLFEPFYLKEYIPGKAKG